MAKPIWKFNRKLGLNYQRRGRTLILKIMVPVEGYDKPLIYTPSQTYRTCREAAQHRRTTRRKHYLNLRKHS